MMTPVQQVVMAVIQITVLISIILLIVPFMTFAERKVIGYIQVRLGATRQAGGIRGFAAGINKVSWAMGRIPILSFFRGLPVFAADGLKLLLKEDIVPDRADRFVFVIAPVVCMIPAFATFAVICFYPGTLFIFPDQFPIVGGLPFTGFLTDINVGLLYIMAVGSIGVYGIVLGGWASNSKYPLLGGLRSAAQIISYEIPLSLSLLAAVVLSGTLNFRELSIYLAGVPTVTAAGAVVQMPLIAAIPLFFGFFFYLTCGFAETNRVPFDLAEAETELVSGFHTEYTGMKFAWFMLAEYANMMAVSAIAAGFFLGGHYLLPFGLQRFVPDSIPFLAQPNLLFFFGKVFFLLFVFLWVRATLPRYRYDQLMSVGWKWLIPVTLVNLLIAAAIRFTF
ncbi:MAG: complex I subunit 1/NuoH family protein [Holophagaceae bacterium]